MLRGMVPGANGRIVMPDYTIRFATLEDAPGIAAVHVESWRTTYPGIVAQDYLDALSVEDLTVVWDRRLRRENRDFSIVIAESPAGALLGFTYGGPLREDQLRFDAELYALYLIRDAQGRGIGKRLVAAWAEHALEVGRRSGVVGVLTANPACRFYERLGARRVKERLHIIGAGSYPAVFYGWDDVHALTT